MSSRPRSACASPWHCSKLISSWRPKPGWQHVLKEARHNGTQRIQTRNRLLRGHRTDVRCLQPGVAPTAAGQGRRAQRPVHRAGRHRLRPDGLLRQPDRDAEHRCARRGRPALQQHAHDGALLADALVHPDRAQPSLERHVVHHRGFHRLSRRERQHPVRERDALRDAAPARLQHLCHRKVAPDAGGSDLGGRAVRSLAVGAGLRALLRLPGRRYAPVLPGTGVRQPQR